MTRPPSGSSGVSCVLARHDQMSNPTDSLLSACTSSYLHVLVLPHPADVPHMANPPWYPISFVLSNTYAFTANNQSSPPGTIDLHGLYVKEAIERTESAIAESQRSGMEELRVIVGKGIHSQGGVGKIKPAVQDLMRK